MNNAVHKAIKSISVDDGNFEKLKKNPINAVMVDLMVADPMLLNNVYWRSTSPRIATISKLYISTGKKFQKPPKTAKKFIQQLIELEIITTYKKHGDHGEICVSYNLPNRILIKKSLNQLKTPTF